MAGESDIFAGVGSGAAAGSVFGPWGTAVGAGVGLVGGLSRYFGGNAQADAMRRQAAEELRRKKLQDAQVFGQTTAAGAASGIDFQESTGLQSYLTSMQAEMRRQQEFMRRSAATNASNVQTAAGFGLLTDLGGTLSNYAKDNAYWRGAP
jgi:hypothetical protein